MPAKSWNIPLILPLIALFFVDQVIASSICDEQNGQAFNTGGRSSNSTGWMVTAILFIILFAASMVVSIYLMVERRRFIQAQYYHREQGLPKNHNHQLTVEARGYF